MAKYELTDEQVKQLMSILANTTIKGADAPAIIDLSRALQAPIKDEEPKKKPAEGK